MEKENYSVLIVTPEVPTVELSLQTLLVDSGLPGLSTYSSSSDEATQALLDLGGLDAVVCQVALRSKSDLETLRMIREIAPDVALVAVAGSPDRSLEPWVIEAGAEDCIFADEVSSVVLHRSVKYAVEHRRAQILLERLARYDPSTGLLNQAGFIRLLERWLYRARTSGRQRFALLVLKALELDDYFDRFDPKLGEEALRTAAERLEGVSRPGDSMGVLEGHELAVLLPEVASRRQARLAADRISSLLEEPLQVRQRDLELTVQWGVTLFERSFRGAREMLDTAVSELDREATRPWPVPPEALLSDRSLG